MLRRRSSSATPPPAWQLPPLEDDNLLWEILLRLPPLPSSLPRASLVCKRWRGVLSDPGFFRSFRKHHGEPPLLGFFFFNNGRGADFLPTLDPPDRIPAARFKLPPRSHRKQGWFFRGCRHGLCLFIDFLMYEAVVCDPITSHQRRIPLPPEFIRDPSNDRALVQNGGVLCVAGHGHVHGDCSLSPFKLVLLYNHRRAPSTVSACLYESESGTWGNIVSKTFPAEVSFVAPSILVGNVLFWLSREDIILEFDMENQSLGVIQIPPNHQDALWTCRQLLRTPENGLDLAVMTGATIEIWARNVNSYGTAQLVIQKTVQLHELFPMGSTTEIEQMGSIRGFDEETNEIFLSLDTGVLMVNLESLQVRNISARQSKAYCSPIYYPYRNFYAAAVDGRRGTKGIISGRGTSEDDQCQAAGAAGGGRT